MSNEKMREEFEVWAKSRDLSIVKYAGGMYVSDHTMWASISWFESRAAFCVELPANPATYNCSETSCEYDCGFSSGSELMRSLCRSAIESIGVRTK